MDEDQRQHLVPSNSVVVVDDHHDTKYEEIDEVEDDKDEDANQS